MLQACREQAFGFERVPRSLDVEIFGADLRRPLDLFPDIGDREASLLANCGLVRSPENFRIDEHTRFAAAILLREVHDEQSFGNPDLDGGEPDSLGGIHALKHVIREPANLGIHHVDLARGGFQAGVGRDKDGPYGHEREIGEAHSWVKAGSVGS